MRLLAIICCVALTFTSSGQRIQLFEEKPIFQNGSDGYACFRIPAIVESNKTLIAFAEGRVEGCSDFGDVDIVLKRSSDNGKTWSPLEVVVDNGTLQAGNPAPLVDKLDPAYSKGRVFLFYNLGIASEHETRLGKGLRTVHYITSIDDGQSWSDPVDITTEVHRPNRPDINDNYSFSEDWRSYALTPGHAIQLRKGDKPGRLFVPANHSQGPPREHFLDYKTQSFFSDDHGVSWNLSDPIEIEGSNEAMAVELSDGTIMQNIRHQPGTKKMRLIALSQSEGESWDEVFFDTSLISPVCQASILSYSTSTGRELVLFSNPEHSTQRTNMTVKASFNQGKTWPVKRTIRSGPSAYSDLVQQSDDRIGLLYEHGNDGGIHYAQFSLAWLVGNGKHDNIPWIDNLVFPSQIQPDDVQLALPVLQYESSIFSDSIVVNAAMDYPEVTMYYTTDGTTPDKNSRSLQNPLMIKNSCELKVVARHPELITSDIVQVTFLKATSVNKFVEEISVHPAPNPKYAGNGTEGLIDFQKGGLNFRNKNWMGFDSDSIEIMISAQNFREVNKITLGLLSDQGSWIFLPQSIEVKDDRFTKKIRLEGSHEKSDRKEEFVSIDLGGQKLKDFSIIIKPLNSIPDWHNGKGNMPWTFIDEVLIDFK